MGHSERFLS